MPFQPCKAIEAGVAGPGPLQQQEMAGEFAVTFPPQRAGKLLKPPSADGQRPRLQAEIPFKWIVICCGQVLHHCSICSTETPLHPGAAAIKTSAC